MKKNIKSQRARTLLTWGIAGVMALAVFWHVSRPNSVDGSVDVNSTQSLSLTFGRNLDKLSGAERLTLRLPININTANASDLEALPRIGPVLAERIIDYRKTHGPFSHVDYIINVHGIGPITLKNMREAGIVANQPEDIGHVNKHVHASGTKHPLGGIH